MIDVMNVLEPMIIVQVKDIFQYIVTFIFIFFNFLECASGRVEKTPSCMCPDGEYEN